MSGTDAYFIELPFRAPPGFDAGGKTRHVVVAQIPEPVEEPERTVGAVVRRLEQRGVAIAGLYPAWKASRLKIVDALRHNI